MSVRVVLLAVVLVAGAAGPPSPTPTPIEDNTHPCPIEGYGSLKVCAAFRDVPIRTLTAIPSWRFPQGQQPQEASALADGSVLVNTDHQALYRITSGHITTIWPPPERCKPSKRYWFGLAGSFDDQAVLKHGDSVAGVRPDGSLSFDQDYMSNLVSVVQADGIIWFLRRNDQGYSLSNDHLKKRISGELVGDRFERERASLRPLPQILPSTCVREPARINKFSEITYKTNRYSTPSRFAHRAATIEIFHDHLRVIVDTIAVAEHPRCFGRNEAVLDPVHFIDLLSFKHRAVVRAEVFRQRSFHHALRTLLSGYVENDPICAGKRFMRVIALLEHHSMIDLVQAVEAALQRGTDDPAAIALTLRQGQQPYRAAPPLHLEPGTRGSLRPTVDLAPYTITALKEYST